MTLAFDGNQIGGSSGCNRYFSEVDEDEAIAGQIEVGVVGGTRMMCPDTVMTVEDRFLEQLGAVSSYTFIGGKLALSWQDGDGSGVMMFAPREP